MTTQKIAVGLIAVALFVGVVTTHAADIDAGLNAYQRGDYATALRIFRQFADQGYAAAQYNLGLMYERGYSVTQNYAEAGRWSRKAADQGDAQAQFNLGVLYYRGRVVTQDYVQAYMWFNLAAAKDFKRARKIRDSLAEMMTPAQFAEVQKLAREWNPKGK